MLRKPSRTKAEIIHQLVFILHANCSKIYEMHLHNFHKQASLLRILYLNVFCVLELLPSPTLLVEAQLCQAKLLQNPLPSNYKDVLIHSCLLDCSLTTCNPISF